MCAQARTSRMTTLPAGAGHTVESFIHSGLPHSRGQADAEHGHKSGGVLGAHSSAGLGILSGEFCVPGICRILSGDTAAGSGGGREEEGAKKVDEPRDGRWIRWGARGQEGRWCATVRSPS